MTHYITAEFAKTIGEKRLSSFNSNPSSVYGIDSEFNISYLNPAWMSFFVENHGKPLQSDDWLLGKNILDFVPKILNEYYENLFRSVLINEKTPLISNPLEYECSSPELYRRFSMHLYPIAKEGILILSSLVAEESCISPTTKGLLKLDEDDYIDEHGFLRQCANCRRVKNQKNPERWDWVPKFVEKPHPKTSHGVCVPCVQQHYLK